MISSGSSWITAVGFNTSKRSIKGCKTAAASFEDFVLLSQCNLWCKSWCFSLAGSATESFKNTCFSLSNVNFHTFLYLLDWMNNSLFTTQIKFTLIFGNSVFFRLLRHCFTNWFITDKNHMRPEGALLCGCWSHTFQEWFLLILFRNLSNLKRTARLLNIWMLLFSSCTIRLQVVDFFNFFYILTDFLGFIQSLKLLRDMQVDNNRVSF